jgi:hypothetical protein
MGDGGRVTTWGWEKAGRIDEASIAGRGLPYSDMSEAY